MAKGGKKGKGKLSKAEKERIKKEEAERKLQEEEEARLRAEQEAREREERERQEREERRLFEEKERARHQAEVDELNLKILQNQQQLATLHQERWKQKTWDRYMLCNGKPDPHSIKELNTYMNLWKEDVTEKKMEDVLQECEISIEIIKEIQACLEGNVQDEDEKQSLKEAVQELQGLIFAKLDLATFQLLKSPWDYIDQETFNITHTARSKNITVCTWGNTAKNPRVKLVEFPEQGFTMEIPKSLAMSDVAVRVMYLEFDFLSEKSAAFYPRVSKEKLKGEKEPEEEGKTESRADQEEGADPEPPTSTSVSGERLGTGSRKFSTKSADNAVKEEEGKEGEQKEAKADNDNEDKEAAVSEVDATADVSGVVEEDELDFLDEDMVDLRSFLPLGPLIYIELVELPPQPKQSKGWVMQQVVESELKRIQYSISAPIVRSTSSNSNNQNQDTSFDESRGSGAPGSNLATPLGNVNIPIAISVSLPKRAIVLEEPQLARWDDAALQWRLDGFREQTYNADDKNISFKTSCFGPYAIMQDLYLNMPFQSWELRPCGLNQCILSIAAASIDIEIEIANEQCRVLKPRDRTEINHILGQWMSSAAVIKELRSVGLNAFALEDGHKYVSICQKDKDLVKSLYQQMALSASAFAYSWSRWNNENKKEDAVVLQAAEWLKRQPVDDEKYALYLASSRICFQLKMTEYDSDFEETIADNTQMHPDLYHMLQDGCSGEAKSLVQNTSYLFADCVFQLITAANVLIYS